MYPLYAIQLMYPLYAIQLPCTPLCHSITMYPLYDIQLPCTPSMPFNYHVPPLYPITLLPLCIPPLCHSITMYPPLCLFNYQCTPSMPIQLMYPLYAIQLPCIPLYDIQINMYPLFNYHVPPLCHSINMYPPPTSSPGPSAREAPDKWPWCRLKKPARILQTPSFWE